jgi:hypothetical protein
LAVDDISQTPLEAAESLFVGATFGTLTEVVRASGGMLTSLGDGHHVQGDVELAVTGA